jgi:hypothetical protein
MPALTQEMINSRIYDCEDDDLSCSKCEVDTLLGDGWDLDMFNEYIPSYLEGSTGDYIRTQCAIRSKRLFKKHVNSFFSKGEISEIEQQSLFLFIDNEAPFEEIAHCLLDDYGDRAFILASIIDFKKASENIFMFAVNLAFKSVENQPSTNRDCHIYFVENIKTSKIKIGRAINLKERIRALSTQSGEELSLVASFKSAPETEQLLHKVFVDCRSIGEWFDSDTVYKKLPFLKNAVDCEQKLHDFVSEILGKSHNWKPHDRIP